MHRLRAGSQTSHCKPPGDGLTLRSDQVPSTGFHSHVPGATPYMVWSTTTRRRSGSYAAEAANSDDVGGHAAEGVGGDLCSHNAAGPFHSQSCPERLANITIRTRAVS